MLPFCLSVTSEARGVTKANNNNLSQEYKIARLKPITCGMVGSGGNMSNCNNDDYGFYNTEAIVPINTADQCNNEGYSSTSCAAYYTNATTCPYNSNYFNCGTANTATQCGLDGYHDTSCAAYYTSATTCPYNSNYFNCGNIDTAAQCNILGYNSTSCAAYYINADTCPFNNTYYNCGTADTATQCNLAGYSSTSCATYYTSATTCPYNSGYYNCGTADTAAQCVASGYSKTSCSSTYELTTQCPYNSSYYQSCNLSCTAMKVQLNNKISTFNGSVGCCSGSNCGTYLTFPDYESCEMQYNSLVSEKSNLVSLCGSSYSTSVTTPKLSVCTKGYCDGSACVCAAY